ncbi:MAG: DUF5683 domain-containing protein, partial [Cytophagales bacterium]
DPYNTLGNPSNPNNTPQSQYSTQQAGITSSADTTQEDTTVVAKEKYGFRNNPFIASIASIIVPGLGQVYNGKFWKVPIFLSIMGTFGYFVYENNRQYQDFRNAYIYLNEKDPVSFDDISREEAITNYNSIREKYENFILPFDTLPNSRAANLMAANRDFSRRNRDWMAVFFLLTYVCNIMDASVDAHFANFDVSDKLSMKIQPTFMAINGTPQVGINVNLLFTDNRRKLKDMRQ